MRFQNLLPLKVKLRRKIPLATLLSVWPTYYITPGHFFFCTNDRSLSYYTRKTKERKKQETTGDHADLLWGRCVLLLAHKNMLLMPTHAPPPTPPRAIYTKRATKSSVAKLEGSSQAGESPPCKPREITTCCTPTAGGDYLL